MVDQADGVNVLTAGTFGPLEDSWCRRVADGTLPRLMIDSGSYVQDGRAPEPGMEIGTHISVPVLLQSGECFGTLCTFSSKVNAHAGTIDLMRVHGAAHLIARRIERARARVLASNLTPSFEDTCP